MSSWNPSLDTGLCMGTTMELQATSSYLYPTLFGIPEEYRQKPDYPNQSLRFRMLEGFRCQRCRMPTCELGVKFFDGLYFDLL
jgi:hypothetical protein